MTNCLCNRPIWLSWLAVASFFSATARGEDAVEQGRDSLNGGVTYPWYDADNDELRRVDPVVPDDEPEEETDPTDFPDEASSFGSFLSTLLQVLFWVFIALLFAALVGVLLWAFARGESKAAADSEETQVVDTGREADRIENLPFKLKVPQGDLLSEARRHYQAGNFRDAIIYLFSYELVQLDRFHFIRLTKGKTNRQYLREVRPRPTISPLLERTMLAFEDVFFGDHSLDRQRFEGCWNGLDEFHRQVSQGAIG